MKKARIYKSNIIDKWLNEFSDPKIERLVEIRFKIANKFYDRLKELNIDYNTLDENERCIIAASKKLSLEEIVDLELKYDFKLL